MTRRHNQRASSRNAAARRVTPVRVSTPVQGAVVAPWYGLPLRPAARGDDHGPAGGRWLARRLRAIRSRRPPWLLNWLAGGAALALLVSAEPTTRPADQPAPTADVAAQAARFAAIDATLGTAVADAQIAALQAHDVALRAFAVQQAARYDELRSQLRALAARLDDVRLDTVRPEGGPTAVALHVGDPLALREVRGPQFDLAYVQHALALNRELLAELDAALGTIEDVELRRALEQLRGTFGATAQAN